MKAFLASISEGKPLYAPNELVRGTTKIDAVWIHEVPEGYDWSKGSYDQDPENEPGFSTGSNQTIVVEDHPLWEACVAKFEKDGEG